MTLTGYTRCPQPLRPQRVHIHYAPHVSDPACRVTWGVLQVGLLFMVMTGVDDVKPLVKYAEENTHLFPIDKSAEMGRPAKLLLVDYMSKVQH